MTEDEFKAKFMDMAARVLGEAQGEELYARARDLVDVTTCRSWRRSSVPDRSIGGEHTMGMTSVEKILARHSDHDVVKPGRRGGRSTSTSS